MNPSSEHCMHPERNLSALLAGFAEIDAHDDLPITGVSDSSTDVRPGDLFLALSGEHAHGLRYGKDALEKGAAAIAWEPAENIAASEAFTGIQLIEVENLSLHASEIAKRFYADPSAKIPVLAVTGTDGKSSVTFFVAQMLEHLGYACGVVGTLGYGRLDAVKETQHTTPSAVKLQRVLADLLAQNCQFAAIEASSHGLQQGRLDRVHIHSATLTNITRDHMDYHASEQAYIQAKSQLFFACEPKVVILNLDDAVGAAWASDSRLATKSVYTYSASGKEGDCEQHLYARDIQINSHGIDFCLRYQGQSVSISTSLLGIFNIENILASTAALLSLGIPLSSCVSAIAKIQAVSGRMQRLQKTGFATAVIDYAHTPAALHSALEAIRMHCEGGVWCVFGCGGDRDKGKRPLMAEAAERGADYLVITNDNPRNEDPKKIIDEIAAGLSEATAYQTIEDRHAAIRYCFDHAKQGDCILIAGKGHEDYQIIGDQKIRLSDEQIVQACWEAGDAS